MTSDAESSPKTAAESPGFSVPTTASFFQTSSVGTHMQSPKPTPTLRTQKKCRAPGLLRQLNRKDACFITRGSLQVRFRPREPFYFLSSWLRILLILTAANQCPSGLLGGPVIRLPVSRLKGAGFDFRKLPNQIFPPEV